MAELSIVPIKFISGSIRAIGALFTKDLIFIAPTLKGDEIIGNVEILKKTKSMVFVDCKLKKKSQIVAQASGVWKVFKK